jgi:hypothetical protein
MYKDYSLFDTDMFHFRLSPHPELNKAARQAFDDTARCAMSSFSLVELKGSYIANLILLYKKVHDSDSLGQTYARIDRSGGRKSKVMFAQLISWLGGIEFAPNPWEEARSELLTHISAQISNSWEAFKDAVDVVLDDINCNRAAEPPTESGTAWRATIVKCRESNTNCNILNFLNKYSDALIKLIGVLNELDGEDKTQELHRIKGVADTIIRTNKKFQWQNGTCRRVGDLIIGLQSKIGKELISSNIKEHAHLHEPLGYDFKRFDVKKYLT